MKYLKYIPAFFLLLAAVYSCKKSDLLNTSELRVYAASGNLAYNIIQGNFNIIGTQVSAGPGTSFPVLLSRPVDRDVEVSLSIDTSLVRVYDSINKLTTPSAKIPGGAFGLQQNGLITIPAGQTASSSVAQVELKNAGLLTEGTSYIVPIVITNANNGVPVSTSRNVIFLKTQLKVIKAGISSLANTNTLSVVLNKANNTVTGPDALYLKALLNDQLVGSTQITVEDAPSLLAAYNQQTGKNFIQMPALSYKLEKSSAIIPEKAMSSSDSVVIRLPNLQLFQTGNNYLLPIQLKTAKNQSADLSLDNAKKVVYIEISVFENNIDPFNTALTGTAIPHTGWSVTASDSFGSAYAADKSIDNNTNTSWLASGIPQWLQLNIGTIKTIKGFNINSASLFGSYFGDITEMEVYSSKDGVSWKLEGIFKSPASATKTVKFLTPVTAQYFRFNITQTDDEFYVGIGELNAVE